MPFNVLLLPLLGGYIFITNWNKTRFTTIRCSGERLLMHAAIAGVFLLMLSFAIVRLLTQFLPQVYHIWHSVIPFEHSGTATGAFLLGAALWIPGNWFFKRDKAIKDTIVRWNDYLEIRLNRAVDETRQMAVTLKNGKTYIGFITRTFDPSFERRFIVILPTKSGYRDSETHELYLTTDYTAVYLRAIADDNSRMLTPPEDFEIVIPVGEILSANFFDPEAYELFNAPSGEAMNKPDEPEIDAEQTRKELDSATTGRRIADADYEPE